MRYSIFLSLACISKAFTQSGTLITSPVNQVVVDGQSYACKCFRGDECWPPARLWASLNTTVGGALQPVTPVGSVCYESFNGKPTYNADQCADIITDIGVSLHVVEYPIAPCWPFYSNNTCDPLINVSTQICTLGYLPEYVIIATTKQHIQAGVKFVAKNNLRLVIRNTGHDFMSRSTGFGSLSINTHRLNSIAFTKRYTGPGSWKGGAVTVGAGVMIKDVYDAAFAQSPKVMVVGGECKTVGIAGGYIQGGGHSPVSGMHGLAADNALQFEIVSAAGDFVTANAAENSDLFWALAGGGPSTFGAVTSVTLKTHPEVPSVGMSMSITAFQDTEKYWEAVSIFNSMMPSFVDAGMYVWWALVPGVVLQIAPFVAPNTTLAEFNINIKPFLDALTANNVTFTYNIQEWPTFYQLYHGMFLLSDSQVVDFQGLLGGRVYTHHDINTNNTAIVSAFRTIQEDPEFFVVLAGHAVNPGHRVSEAHNAANPAWRKAASHVLTTIPSPENVTQVERKYLEDVITNRFGKLLRDAGPESFSYVNEGDVNEINWQETYWGTNYPRLLGIKKKWDPRGVFYAKSTPGTEDWSEVLDGKLCKKLH